MTYFDVTHISKTVWVTEMYNTSFWSYWPIVLTSSLSFDSRSNHFWDMPQSTSCIFYASPSIHHHRSRGCKTLTFQSWRSKKIASRMLFYFIKMGSNGSDVESLLDLQLWHVTVLQPLELWWWIVAHLKFPRHMYLHLT